MIHSLLPALALWTGAYTQDGADCALSEADTQWIDTSVAAWRRTARDILRIELPATPIAVFFDAKCIRSAERLASAGDDQVWELAPHDGEILLPDGNALPPMVASFAAPLGDDGGSFFVMSTPSIWRRGGVQSEFGLERLMTAVLIHELSHTSQVATYMRRVSELEAAGGFGDELTDDVLQDTFGGDPEFARRIESEIDVLFRAAATEDDEEARALARTARDALRERREGYAERVALHELEDVFLTLEGSAQWSAFTWLIAPDGASVEHAVAMRDFGRRSGRWSQIEGLGMFLLIDRFVPTWRREVYGDGSATALGLLDRALD